MVCQLDENIWFPDPKLADEDGLLAVGGDLSPERLILAYHHGIFPWYSDETPILWYAPHTRFVLYPNKLKISKSMRKLLERNTFTYTYNQQFKSVIENCASADRDQEGGTWINADMQRAYIELHKLGYAHSVEVWMNNQLAGGLYGVVINRVFCGESMFSLVSNASKAALIWLCNKKFRLIDCQVYTKHLESMGAEFISCDEYLKILKAT